MTQTTIQINHLIAEAIQLKYKMRTSYDFDTISNFSLDSFYPKSVLDQKYNQSTKIRTLSSNFAISELIANEYMVRKINIEELLNILDYSKAYIKTLLLNVKKKKIDITLLGFGGGNSNLYWWIQELASFTLTFNIFDKIDIFDPDIITETNILRFPFDVRTHVYGPKKIDMLKGGTSITSKESRYFQKLPMEYIEKEKLNIYIGGPDIETRELLSKSDVIYYSLTHGDNDIDIIRNPEQNSTLQIESYGTVDLSIFFMNQLAATIGLLEILAKEDFSNTEIRTKSETLFTYSFVKKIKEANNTIVAKGKTYKFPITEEEYDAIHDDESSLSPDNNSPDESIISEESTIALPLDASDEIEVKETIQTSEEV